ncbi:hypothetical protein Ancab_023789 [Ancistrocladus abbreviatus]
MLYPLRLLVPLSNFWAFSNLCTSQLTHLQFLRHLSSSPAAIEEDEQRLSFTISYLVSSCGLSPKRALSIPQSHGLKFDSPEKPDSVLALLRNHGFTDAHVAKFVHRYPLALCYYPPERTLLPKIEFLHSIGISKEDLPDVICRCPYILRGSLENLINPAYSMLKSILQSNEKVFTTINRLGPYFVQKSTKNLCPNVALLKEIGIPDSRIVVLLYNRPQVLFIEHLQFRGLVDEVVKLGFDTSKVHFLFALHVQWNLYKATRDRCVKIYEDWGWSNADISLAFQRHPFCLILSENKLVRILDLLMNKMAFPAGEIAKVAIVFSLSFETRIFPRCSVLKVLLLKGLIKEKWTLRSVLQTTEKYFLERFVTRYHEDKDELLSLYKGEVDPFEASFSERFDKNPSKL